MFCISNSRQSDEQNICQGTNAVNIRVVSHEGPWLESDTPPKPKSKIWWVWTQLLKTLSQARFTLAWARSAGGVEASLPKQGSDRLYSNIIASKVDDEVGKLGCCYCWCPPNKKKKKKKSFFLLWVSTGALQTSSVLTGSVYLSVTELSFLN